MNGYSCKLDIDIIANGIFTLRQIDCIHNQKILKIIKFIVK
jgi:hypothetical protein